MYFCPKCNYSFDINKSTGTVIDDETEKPQLKKINDILKVFESGESLSKYIIDLKIEDLEKNPKYKKLSDTDKEKFMNELLYQSSNIGAQFKCNNCGFSKEITETTLLYQLDLNDKIKNIKTIEENELMCNNPILPRTHDYYCKNEACITLTDNTIKKEAVFFRDRDTYKVNYICTICYHSW